MARLGPTGLTQVFTDIKNWVNSKLSTKADTAHTHTTYAVKHAYTTAANAAKNWYRIANANTKQVYTGNPIHAEFILTAYNSSYDPGYSERWYVRAMVLGRNAHVIIFGGNTAPFNQCRVLYENTLADIDDNDRPAIDIYLNYVLANGTTKIEIEEVYNQGWTFVADGQLAVSTVPTGFENTAVGVRGNGVERSTYSDIATYLNKPRRDITSNVTLADNNTYRSTTLNCTGNRTITLPSINSAYFWCVIKNFNAEAGIITIHPSTTSVLIDGSNDDIILRPGEFVTIHSRANNSYSIVGDNRKRTCLVGRSGEVGTDTKHWFRVAQKTLFTAYRDAFILFDVFQVASDSSYMGRLCAHVRVDNTIGVVGNKQFTWLYRGTQLSDDDFAMTTIETSGTSLVVDIWCKRSSSYSAFAFAVVSEGFSTDSLDSPAGKWILTRERATVGDLESLDTGFTTVTNPSVVTLANSITGNAGSATIAQQVRKDPAAGSTADLLYSQCAGTDIFRLQVGGASNAGYAEIATADDGSEPIYVRQYKGTFTSLQRTATLLDGSGNTSFPGQVTGVTFNGPLTWSGTAFSYNAGNSLYFYSGQPAIANCFEGSSNDFTKFSYPTGGTSVSSSNANIQTLRLDWGNTYWHDLFMSPNNNYLWHRNVVNSDARGWRRIVEENVTGLTDQSWNINIAGNATTVTGTAGTSTLAWGSEVTLYTVGGNAIKAKLPANPNSDTKNTAGSTDSSSKLFLIGATTQEANPQTYSHDTAYVGTDGCLYSGGAKVLTAHQSLANYVDLSSTQTITGKKLFTNSAIQLDNVTSMSGSTMFIDTSASAPRGEFPAEEHRVGRIYIGDNTSYNGAWFIVDPTITTNKAYYRMVTTNPDNTDSARFSICWDSTKEGVRRRRNVSMGDLLPQTASTYNLGESGNAWQDAYINKIHGISDYTNLKTNSFNVNTTLTHGGSGRRVILAMGAITLTVPAPEEGSWFLIKAVNGLVTLNLASNVTVTGIAAGVFSGPIHLQPNESILLCYYSSTTYNATISTIRRSGVVGRTDNVPAENPKHWFKIAENYVTATYRDPFICLRVFESTTGNTIGTLCAHCRINNTVGVVDTSNCYLQWQDAGAGFNLSKYALTTNETSGTGVTISLWCQLTGGYSSLKFEVVSECGQSDQLGNPEWVLTRRRQADGDLAELLDTDFTKIVYSTLTTLKNDTTGKASNVTGTVAIANGGTGATTRLNAIKALTNESVGTPTHFLAITTNWGKAGYTTVAQAKTVLGITGDMGSHSDSEYVHKTGDETIGGNKTFSNNIAINGTYLGTEASGNERTNIYLLANRDTAGTSGAYIGRFRQNRTQGAMESSDVSYITFDFLENSTRYTRCFTMGMTDWDSDKVPQTYYLTSPDGKGSLGTATTAWNKVYANSYYLGTTSFTDKFVTTDTAQTITGVKTLSSDTLVANQGNAYRIANSAGTGYGVFQRTDGTYWYMLVTANNDPLGTWTSARPITIRLSDGYCTINGKANEANKVQATIAADATTALVQATVASNDCFRIAAGGAANAGWAEIATGDDANEPIYVRQYKGSFTTLQRTATLLDGSGNTSFPGTVTATGFSGPLTGNVTGTASKATSNANGNEITDTVIKGLSISGKTITYTKIDGNTGTLTTQDTVYTHPTTSGNKHIPSGGSSGQFLGWDSDGTAKWVNNPNTNTDTLMTQNVSTTDSTYPILLCATANATSNQGAKTGIFGSGVKVNPKTSVVSAKGFSGIPTGNTYVTAVKDGGALVNSQATSWGAIWRAPTKDYQVAGATWSNTNNNVYICYSVTNANAEAGTNTMAKSLIWAADTGTLTTTTFSGALSGNASSATEFSANKSVTLTGDVTGTASSKAGWSVATTLANSGVTAGTYGPSADVTGNNNATILVPEITVDAKGRVTAVTNRTYKSVNTDSDKKVYQYYKSDDDVYRLLFSNNAGNTATSNVGAVYSGLNNSFYVNPSTGSLYATKLYSGGTEVKVTDYDTHIADTDIHVTTADKNRWNNQTYVFRYSSTALTASSTNSNALLDNTDNLKVGDKVIDSSGVLFSITAIDTQNSTFTIGTALIDLAKDSDAVRYNTVQSLSTSQKLQARTNINAFGTGEFKTHCGVKLTTNNDYLQLLSTNNNILSKIPWNTIPNVYNRNEPVVTNILWSGDLNSGDITLSEPFIDYDVLMCVYGTNDNSPGTAPWNFSVIPVWMLKKVIVDKNVFGVVPSTFDIVNDHERRWEIKVADSHFTFFKWNYDATVKMWRIIGIRYTSAGTGWV